MSNKNIVFDFDNTIGDFKQCIYILNHTQFEYNEVFDKLNECFRPNIFIIFENIIKYKNQNKINNVILYSNNNNEQFVNIVINYIHKKLNTNLFDKIITISHPKRKTSNKNMIELMNCSDGLITNESKVCFIDDKRYSEMKNSKRVFYIQCEKYKNYIKDSILFKKFGIKNDSKHKNNEYLLSYRNYLNLSEQIIDGINFFVYKF
jgi:hypothetical protein